MAEIFTLDIQFEYNTNTRNTIKYHFLPTNIGFRPKVSCLKLFYSSRRTQPCAAIVCTPKFIFLYSDDFRQPGGVVSRSRKIPKKEICVI